MKVRLGAIGGVMTVALLVPKLCAHWCRSARGTYCLSGVGGFARRRFWLAGGRLEAWRGGFVVVVETAVRRNRLAGVARAGWPRIVNLVQIHLRLQIGQRLAKPRIVLA